VYGLPPDPVVPTAQLPRLWRTTALAAAAVAVGVAAAFLGGSE
jgi:formate dehydrogenase iron-sulfur subunit